MIKNTVSSSLFRPVIYASVLALSLVVTTGAAVAENSDAVAPNYQTGVVNNTGTTQTPPPATAPLINYETGPNAAQEPYAPAPNTTERPRASSPSGDDPYAVAPSVETGAVGDPR